MPDMWLDVDAALSEVPVNILPLIDDTDFKTREIGIVYNQAGMDLVWNFVTSAGAFTQTAVTPTTSGDYDWAHQGDGMYSIEIPASGGASINNDTEGYGWFTGICTGVLPWRGPVIGFRASGLNDLLCDSAYSATRGLTGTALPAVAAEGAGGLFTRGSGAGQINQQANGQVDANVERLGNGAQSLTDLKDFADAGYDPATNKVEGVKLADTTTTNTDMVGTDSAALASVCTEGRLGELDAANLPADIDTLLTRVPDTISLAAIQAEAEDALEAFDLDHFIKIAAGIPSVTAGTFLDQIMRKAAGTFNRETDSLEGIRDTAPLGTAMRGTDSAATEAKQDIIDTVVDAIQAVTDVLPNSGALTDIDTGINNLETRLTALRAGYLDELAAANIPADIDTLLSRVTAAVALASVCTEARLSKLDATISSRATPAQVNTEVADVMKTDTKAEPGQGAPPATASLEDKIAYLYKAWRNLAELTSTFYKLYNDAGDTVDQKAPVSDDGSTYSLGEVVTGP